MTISNELDELIKKHDPGGGQHSLLSIVLRGDIDGFIEEAKRLQIKITKSDVIGELYDGNLMMSFSNIWGEENDFRFVEKLIIETLKEKFDYKDFLAESKHGSALRMAENHKGLDKIFKPSLWVNNIQGMEKLWQQVKDKSNKKVNIQEVRQRVLVLSHPEFDPRKMFKIESLFQKDEASIAPLDDFRAWEKIIDIGRRASLINQPLTKKHLINNTTENGIPYIERAFQLGKGEEVLEFLQWAYDPLTKEDVLELGLGKYFEKNNNVLWSAANKGDTEEVLNLLESGYIDINFNPNPQDYGNPLYQACIHGHAEIAIALLNYGAEPDYVREENDYSILGYSAYKGHENIVDILIDRIELKYIDNPAALLETFTHRDGDGDTILKLSANSKESIKEKVNQAISRAIDKFDKADLKLDNPIVEKHSLLNLSVRYGKVDIAKQFLREILQDNQTKPKKIIEILTKNHNGKPSIEREAQKSKNEELQNLINVMIEDAKAEISTINDFVQEAGAGNLDFIKKVFKKGKIGIDETSGDKEKTALFTASVNGQIEVVKYLLSKGADPDKRTSNNLSPLSDSTYYGKSEVVELLVEQLEKQYVNHSRKLYEALTFKDGDGNTMRKNANNGGSETKKIIGDAVDRIKEKIGTDKIVIIGSGFSGTMTAIHLFKNANKIIGDKKEFTEIVLIEKSPEQRGGGLAYSKATANKEHYINIQAERMSAFHDSRRDFTNWLQDKHFDLYRDGRNKVPRRIYQEYLNDRLELYQGRNPGLKLTKLDGKVVDADELQFGGKVILEDGTEIEAVQIIQANGHTHPVEPRFTKNVVESDKFLQNQWGEEAKNFMSEMDKEASVFIIGTSMSAYDAVVSLKKRGHEGDIVMMSRNGLTHPIYAKGEIPEQVGLSRPKFMDADNEVDFIAGVRKEFMKLSRRYSGEQILANWERYVPEVVEKFGEEITARLLKQHKSLIDTNRIGVSYKIGNIVEEAISTGQVQIWTGNIQNMKETEEGIKVSYVMSLSDGSSKRNRREFGYVISSLGQEINYDKVKDQYWVNLRDKGMISSHFTGIGIKVDEDGQIIDKEGKASNVFLAVGPMRGGDTIVREKDYTEKSGSGGRLGPTTLSVIMLKSQAHEVALKSLENFIDIVQQKSEVPDVQVTNAEGKIIQQRGK